MRALQRDGHPTPLGDATARYGRIFKSLHTLAYVDDGTCRRDIKGMRNLQEGRHSLAEKIFHGRKGQIYKAYERGMEDQLDALGLGLLGGGAAAAGVIAGPWCICGRRGWSIPGRRARVAQGASPGPV